MNNERVNHWKMQNYSNTGIEHDSYKAPWNQKDQKEEEFRCLCCQTLSKSSPVFTSDYVLHYEDECSDYDISNVNWESEYHDNDHYTPIQLIGILKDYITKDLMYEDSKFSKKQLEHLLEECEGWSEDETTYMED